MKQKNRILLHALYWSFLIPTIVTFFIYNLSDTYYITNVLLPVPLQLITFYLAYLVLFPKFLSQKLYLKFSLWSLISTILIAALFLLIYIVLKPFLIQMELLRWNKTKNSFLHSPTSYIYFYTYFLNALRSLVAGCLLKGFISWFGETRQKELLKRKNIQIELALLRAQINPHFLFNTLNNIDILIEKEPQKASLYLNKLSDILRFTIYDSSSENISLAQELEYIEKYLELQKIRTTNQYFIKFEVEGNPDNLLIAPMLFIPFIENAFKHSTDKKIDEAITIHIKIVNNEIRFICRNAINQQSSISASEGGVGLDIIKNRLSLIYPDYKLKIDKTNSFYEVNLSLSLHEN